MDEHPNATAYRRTADAFRADDREALAALIDEDVVWHVPGSGPLAGDIDGREALFRFFDRLGDVTEGTFTIAEHDVLGSDEHVVALSTWSGVRDGMPVSVGVWWASSTIGTVGSENVGTTPRIWPPWIAYSAGRCDVSTDPCVLRMKGLYRSET